MKSKNHERWQIVGLMALCAALIVFAMYMRKWEHDNIARSVADEMERRK